MDRYYEFAETRLKIQDHFTYTPDLAYEKFAVDPCSVDYTMKYQAVTSFPSEWMQGDLLYKCPSFKIIQSIACFMIKVFVMRWVFWQNRKDGFITCRAVR